MSILSRHLVARTIQHVCKMKAGKVGIEIKYKTDICGSLRFFYIYIYTVLTIFSGEFLVYTVIQLMVCASLSLVHTSVVR